MQQELPTPPSDLATRGSTQANLSDAPRRTVRLDAPESTFFAPFFLGPGGSLLHKLELQSGCKINLERYAFSERKVVISGSSEDCERAAELVREKIAAFGGNMPNMLVSVPSTQAFIGFLYEKRCAGLIQLQDETGTRIQREDTPGTLGIYGPTDERCKRTAELIQKKIAEFEKVARAAAHGTTLDDPTLQKAATALALRDPVSAALAAAEARHTLEKSSAMTMIMAQAQQVQDVAVRTALAVAQEAFAHELSAMEARYSASFKQLHDETEGRIKEAVCFANAQARETDVSVAVQMTEARMVNRVSQELAAAERRHREQSESAVRTAVAAVEARHAQEAEATAMRTLRENAAANTVDINMHTYVAMRQYVELLRTTVLASNKRAKEDWKIPLDREALGDMLGAFKRVTSKTRYLMFANTRITFSRGGEGEDGVDEGGLTAEAFTLFFREILKPGSLFESGIDGQGVLPRADASESDLRALGLTLLKCCIDDQPIGTGLGRFVFEFLVDSHERRVFHEPHAALRALADFDPELAARWRDLLRGTESSWSGLTPSDFDDTLLDSPLLTSSELAHAIISGCRRRLLTDRAASLAALREGFLFVDLQIQLAPMSCDELRHVLEGKHAISSEELIACFELNSFSGKACVPIYLSELIRDPNILDDVGRLQLLEWCTGLSALPVGGLSPKIKLCLYEDATEQTLPEVHTCTRELHMPEYSSSEKLQERLLYVLRGHRSDGFHMA